MSKLQRILRSSAIYFAGSVLTKLISFFMLPLYTSRIVPADFGYYDFSITYLSILIPVISMNIWVASMRFMYEYESERERYKVFFNTLIILSAALLVYSLIFIALGLTSAYRFLPLIYLFGFFSLLQNYYTYIARGLGFNKVFAISGMVSALVNSLSNLLLILVFQLSIEALYISMILGFFVQICILEHFVKLRKNVSRSLFDFLLLKQLVQFSYPLAFNSASFWFLSSYNKIGIEMFFGFEGLGYYSAAAKFTVALGLVSDGFAMAWQELAYSSSGESTRDTMYSKAANLYVQLLLYGTALMIPAISIAFPYFIDKQYAASYPFVPFYMLAIAASIFSNFYGEIFSAEKRNKHLVVTTILAASVNVGLFHLLAASLGVQAANIALFMGFLTNILLRNRLLSDRFKIHFEWGRLLLLCLLLVLSFALYFIAISWLNLLFFIVLAGSAFLLFKDLLRSVWALLGARIKKVTAGADQASHEL